MGARTDGQGGFNIGHRVGLAFVIGRGKLKKEVRVSRLRKLLTMLNDGMRPRSLWP
jgi:hypothetical protein